MITFIGIAIFLVLIAAAIWASRSPPSSCGPDNQSAAGRYGPG